MPTSDSSCNTVRTFGQTYIGKGKRISPFRGHHLEAYRRIGFSHRCDIHFFYKTDHWSPFTKFFRIHLHLCATRLQILSQQNRTVVTFVESAALHHFQSQNLRQVPTTIHLAKRYCPVSEIASFCGIGIRATDEFHRIRDIFYLRMLSQLFSQPI